MDHGQLSPSLLRQLQKEINASIDEYVRITDGPNGQQHGTEVEVKRCQARISEWSQALAFETEEPAIRAYNLGFSSTINVAVKMAVDLGIFKFVNGPTTIDQLQQKTGADGVLLQRIMRMLAVERWVTETGPDAFEPNHLTAFVNEAPVEDWVRMNFDMTDPLLAHVPAYFASRSYQAPSSSGSDPPAKRAFGFSTLFEWLKANPAQMATFSSAMRIQQLQSPMYIPSFPFAAKLARSKPLGPDDVAIVDIGGGLGQWLEQTLRDDPSLAAGKGRMVLQDLPSVIDSEACTKDPRIERCRHDFFTPQPVKGARYYHMRAILHDWPDDDCLRILENLAPAFHKAEAPDSKLEFSSKLLITGWVVPAERCSLKLALADMAMMVANGMERTASHYSRLLANTGFKLLKIWPAQLGPSCVIEAELM